MATDGPDPTPCNPEIFARGEVMFVTDSISSNRMESWVRKVAEISGQPADWHFAGGRAIVKALGDTVKVRSAMDDLFPLLEDLRRSSNRGCGDPDCKDPNCTYGKGFNRDPLSAISSKVHSEGGK